MRTRWCRLLLLVSLLAVPWSAAYAVTATLTWTGSVADATHDAARGYKVWRGTTSAACTGTASLSALLATINTTTTSYTDTTVPNTDGVVCYEVSATNDAGESPHSNRATQTVNIPNVPNPPTTITITITIP